MKVLIAAIGCLLASGTAFAADVKLRLGHATTTESTQHQAALKLAELVKERTKGAVEISVFPGSSLGSDQQMINLTRGGSHRHRVLGLVQLQRHRASDRAARNAVRLSRLQPCLQGARRQGRPGPARRARQARPQGPRPFRERMARADQQQAPGADPGRRQGPEDPQHAEPVPPPGLPAARDEPVAAADLGALLGVGDARLRRAGAPDPGAVVVQVLRGPEIPDGDQSRLLADRRGHEQEQVRRPARRRSRRSSWIRRARRRPITATST